MTTRNPGRYITRTNCCGAPVAFDVNDATPDALPADFPEVTRDERRRIMRSGEMDPREVYVRENGPVVYAFVFVDGRAFIEDYTRAQGWVLCPKCDTLNHLRTGDMVRGTLNDTTCSHSCVRAASVDCACSCGGAHHGELHTV